MKMVMQNYRTGELQVVDAPPPQLKEGTLLIRTAHSLISAGTEKTKVDTAQRSLVGKAQARPDLVKQVIQKARREGLWKTWQTVSDRLNAPVPMGYSCAGVVLATAGDVGDIRAGDRVACAGNHSEIVCMPKNLVVRIPDEVSSDFAAFTTVGAIAMQGVRQADVRVGERTLVIGLGLLGLIAIQILKAAGCKVFGIDIDPTKAEAARAVGCDVASLATDPALEEMILTFTEGYGVDSTIITASSPTNNGPIEQAAEFTRDKGRVVVVGGTKMDIPREPFYLKELELRLSRSYGPGRYDRTFEDDGQDYPYAYVRFTERRNMSSFLELVADGSVQLAPLITHRFPIEDAARAYDVIRGANKEKYLGILLDYDQTATISSRVQVRTATPVKGDRITLGVIGAGKYATTHLIPFLREHPAILLGSICTGSGLTAVHGAQRFGFNAADADADAVIAESDAVLVATRHNDHADYVTRTLKLGKAVFVEKPMVIDAEQLRQVSEATSYGGSVTVGFNRRFAPATLAAKKHLGAGSGPRQVLIRINAGPIPADHWMLDPKTGGGRLIGEGCHFVDLAAFLCDSAITTVHAIAVPQPRRSHALLESFSIHLTMANGSIATVLYTSIGDAGLPKEHIEVFRGGRVAIIRDFKELELWSGGKKVVEKWRSQNKGQQEQVGAWIKGLRDGLPPIPFPELVNVHQACFAALRSMETGGVIPVEEIADISR